ncbi:hypothetical protein BBIA_2120 [Bifidobacterium biavatii DSM 23969]|uniref:Lipoprotein n=1 Tax=Bifidobacterium biavatii DSM 23969 TaxID=1437608 RepID=A0A086ZS39_9BIFI|nr:hypothetical protein BBIA_2120 [Bifidobacterium biavatii DSM 23969]
MRFAAALLTLLFSCSGVPSAPTGAVLSAATVAEHASMTFFVCPPPLKWLCGR